MGLRANIVHFLASRFESSVPTALKSRFRRDVGRLNPNQGGVIENGRAYSLTSFINPRSPYGVLLNQWLEQVDKAASSYEPIFINTPLVYEVEASRVNDAQGVLEDFASGKLPYPALHLKGLPVGHEGKTLEKELWNTATTIGHPYVEVSEGSQVIQNIKPRKNQAKEQSSGSSDAELVLHMENPGTERVPDYVGIACVRNLEGAETTLVNPLKTLHAMLEKGYHREAALLFEPKFWLAPPYSFDQNRPKSQGWSLFDGSIWRPDVTMDFEAMGSDSKAHADAFEIFKQEARSLSQRIILEPGDILFIRNTAKNLPDGHWYEMSLHGRKPFSPHPDSPRFLKRVYVKSGD